MIQMTLQIPDELAERIEPLSNWLPTIIELSLIGFNTMATATASEIVRFLATNPTPQRVLVYYASDESQQRLRRLLALNEAGMLSEIEQTELGELQQIEHVIIMLKARVASELQ